MIKYVFMTPLLSYYSCLLTQERQWSSAFWSRKVSILLNGNHFECERNVCVVRGSEAVTNASSRWVTACKTFCYSKSLTGQQLTTKWLAATGWTNNAAHATEWRTADDTSTISREINVPRVSCWRDSEQIVFLANFYWHFKPKQSWKRSVQMTFQK